MNQHVEIKNIALPHANISQELFIQKYAKGSEKQLSFSDALDSVRLRVAKALASVESDCIEMESEFLWALSNGFIPAGRILSSAGTDIAATLINCFVQPVGDSTTCDEKETSIYTALKEATETMRRGGGVGYDFSKIRPKSAKVKGTNSLASGPLSFMDTFDCSCRTVESAGNRRGAQMGVLRIDNPSILEFINAKKEPGRLTQFNVSVGVTDAFIDALNAGESFQLVHDAEPSDALQERGAFLRDDGKWCYSTIDAVQLWEEVMKITFDYAEPGILLIDRINQENNLQYKEILEATNPCGEQPLPAYGCCCLGSVNLSLFVSNAFSDDADFDYDKLERVSKIAIRMLDNVLDITHWPLEKQKEEAYNKRRVGLGITGLADALLMLRTRYGSTQAQEVYQKIQTVIRDSAYSASIDLAKEKGSFTLFEKSKYMKSPFIQRLPKKLKDALKTHGIRNSHLLAIAPTGTISLTVGNNCANGIEPHFSWFYDRKIRTEGEDSVTERVSAFAYRLYETMFGKDALVELPDYFVCAMDGKMSVDDHLSMVKVAAPLIDAAISKTINIPEDYSFDDFKGVYTKAIDYGLKGITTYRPSDVRGSVLSIEGESVTNFDDSDPDRKIKLTTKPEKPFKALRWPSRPDLLENVSRTFFVKHPHSPFAVFIGELEDGQIPFEVWVNGIEAPRGLQAIAKALSMDMRALDKSWLRFKLDALRKTQDGENAFDMTMPDGSIMHMPSATAAMVSLIEYRCKSINYFDDSDSDSPMLDAMMCVKEPKTKAQGSMSWFADIQNPSTGDDFVLFLKEVETEVGTRPFSIWLAGVYPKELDGLCKLLSIDLRMWDLKWVAKKLKSLLKFPEPTGEFFASIPDSNNQRSYPSTIAYIAELILYRYRMLGLLDESNNPINNLGFLEEQENTAIEQGVKLKGKKCTKCFSYSVVKHGGCDLCSNCGDVGSCG